MGSNSLTHISLASYLWDIGKQYSSGCDAAEHGVPSGAILFAKKIKCPFEKLNKIKKITPDSPRNESGHIKIITMGKSIRNKWVHVL